jgi:O-antigen ligase
MMMMSSAFVIAAAMIAFAGDTVSRRPRPRAGLVKVLMVALLVTGVISTAGFTESSNIHWWFWQLSGMLALVAGFDLATRSLVNRETVKRFLIATAASLVAFNFAFSFRTLLSAGPTVIGRLDELLSKMTVGAFTPQVSGLALVLLGLAMGIAISRVPKADRLRAALLGIGPAAIVLLLYLSKGGLITALSLLVIALFVTKRRVAAFTVSILIALSVAVFVAAEPLYQKSFKARFQELGQAATGRARIRQEAIRLTKTSPFFGIGLGQFRFTTQMPVMSAHNETLNIAAEQGVLSAAIYLLLIGTLAWKAWRARKVSDPFRKSIVFGATLSGIAYVIYTQIAPQYWLRAGVMMAALTGMLYVCAEPTPEEEYQQADWESWQQAELEASPADVR